MKKFLNKNSILWLGVLVLVALGFLFTNSAFAIVDEWCGAWEEPNGDEGCNVCEAGYASDNGLSCDICPVGTYGNSEDESGLRSTACLACPEGQTSPAGSASFANCQVCGEDEYATEDGHCEDIPACSAGSTFAVDAEPAQCRECPIGTFNTDGLACVICWEGTYASRGASICTECPDGMSSKPQSESPEQCFVCEEWYVEIEGVCTLQDSNEGNEDEEDNSSDVTPPTGWTFGWGNPGWVPTPLSFGDLLVTGPSDNGGELSELLKKLRRMVLFLRQQGQVQ